jgi:hypothetical protein
MRQKEILEVRCVHEAIKVGVCGDMCTMFTFITERDSPQQHFDWVMEENFHCQFWFLPFVTSECGKWRCSLFSRADYEIQRKY